MALFLYVMSASVPIKSGIAAVTQKMVSRRAGVSQVTVSHVLGGKGSNYSERTRERVRQAVEALGYRPNRAAQMMRRGRSNTVVHLNCGGYSELAGRKTYHMGRLVHEAGFDYQVIDSYWWPEEGSKIIDRIFAFRPEGVIVSGSLQTEIDFRVLSAAGVPIVFMDIEARGYPVIRHDVRAAFAELTRECLAQDRCPALLLKATSASISQEGTWHWTMAWRRAGYLKALEQAGIPSEDVREIEVGAAFPSDLRQRPAIFWDVHTSLPAVPTAPFEAGERAVRWLIASDGLPEALICSNDFYALGALAELSAAGISVPEKIAVTGFDNLSYAAHRAVSLTTIEHPVEVMCGEALVLLRQQMSASARKKLMPDRVFPCRIHWRKTLSKISSSAARDTRRRPRRKTPIPVAES